MFQQPRLLPPASFVSTSEGTRGVRSARRTKRTHKLRVVHLLKRQNTFQCLFPAVLCSSRNPRLANFATNRLPFTTQPPAEKVPLFRRSVRARVTPCALLSFSAGPPLRSSPWQRVNPDVCTGSSALAPACRVPRCLVSCQRRPTAGQGGGLWWGGVA